MAGKVFWDEKSIGIIFSDLRYAGAPDSVTGLPSPKKISFHKKGATLAKISNLTFFRYFSIYLPECVCVGGCYLKSDYQSMK